MFFYDGYGEKYELSPVAKRITGGAVIVGFYVLVLLLVGHFLKN